jgi:tungstate transport system ATP-binding protein
VAVVKDLSLDVGRGEVLALIGPNGAGKSSLIQALAGLLSPAVGQLQVDGQPLCSERERLAYRRRLTVVFPEPHLLDTSVAENVGVGLRLRGVPALERRQRVTEVLAQFGIAPLERRAARTLSSGEARKVSLARAFATRPELVLLDEPFTALDLPVREEIAALMADLLRRGGITAIMATHDSRELFRLSSRFAQLDRGRLVRCGTPRELLEHPADPFAAAFSRHANHSQEVPP